MVTNHGTLHTLRRAVLAHRDSDVNPVTRLLLCAHQVRRGQEHCSETLFQLRREALFQRWRLPFFFCGLSCAHPSCAHPSCARCYDIVLASLSAVGERAIQAHAGCMNVLRHHARVSKDLALGGRCRGALAAISTPQAPPKAATATLGVGHLMISYAHASRRACASNTVCLVHHSHGLRNDSCRMRVRICVRVRFMSCRHA